MKIDLRSDTVTRPSLPMMEAIMNAQVGDDVFGNDPTVFKLERITAELFGMEAALFCPSGTMTNQLAIRSQCEPGSEIICDRLSHIYLYEGGGVALNAFSSVRTIEGNRGRISAEQIISEINDPNDIHQPKTRMVSLENTVNKGGGSIYDFKEIQKIGDVCKKNNLVFHLDGARLFNAIVETDESAKDFGKTFDSISICLSKGLGCPVGSMLVGSKALIEKSRRFRKAMGGGWRQAGFMAAAGIYALENNIERLKEDHEKAKIIGNILAKKSFVKNIYPIETNIAIFELQDSIVPSEFISNLEKQGVLAVSFGKNLVRFVTHLDFSNDNLSVLESVINKI